ncbi:hypothetical protein [Streptomyces sulphureus]|uniref:hypothetical protein n=1 Tax=Streptomyces sulphureus TaxID=47758 RepID=UPI00036EAA2E|nr:hypothetical protein [Streptomyces sulphureus]
MYSLDQISNATAQLTGESLEGARLRLGTLTRFDRLVPEASADQGLLESVLATALGSVDGQSRPFGVREARPLDSGLLLRLEREEEVQGLFGLLPYRAKRGAWRGVRGLFVETVGAQLRFRFRPWLYKRYPRLAAPEVLVAGPHGADLPALLAAHAAQIVEAGHKVQWNPQRSEPGPKRQEPVERSLVRRLGASYALGSALLRRPRLWDSLDGFAGVQMRTEMADHGLDWVVERSVAEAQFDDDRLIGVLTDGVVGCRLRVLDHACGAGECTVRLAPRPGMWGWRGVLTVHSRRVPAAQSHERPRPRPLTAIGERLNVTRPLARVTTPRHGSPDVPGVAIQLTTVPNEGVQREELAWVAEQIAAVWTVQGLKTALVQTHERHHLVLFRDHGQPSWATARVPGSVATWRRLRIAPPPGELWALAVPGRDDDAAAAAIAHARRAFDRILVVTRTDWVADAEPLNQRADVRILVHREIRYERHISLHTTAGHGPDDVELTPSESAMQWRQQELGRWDPQHAVRGMLLLTDDDQKPLPDEFDSAVEEQLARYGTPVLGRFPANRLILHGAGHSPHPPTVLDPETGEPTHSRMTAAAVSLARRLWPGAPHGAEREHAPNPRVTSPS